MANKGFKDEDLKAVGERMEAGTSAIIAVAEDRLSESEAACSEDVLPVAAQRASERVG